MPWRNTKDPYHILVSEIMLQQTQVDRTIPKFKEFIRTFPTAQKLATASTKKVLQVWQGMGYNRRVLNLQKAAQAIVTRYAGTVPHTIEQLVDLPGIGPYTARAIMAFAFDQPVVLIETNVRTVYLYHFFPKKQKVRDDVLMPLIEQTLDSKHPRQWYSALMDYGSYLKKTVPNPSRRSIHHTKQSKFEGSLRQARGAVLRSLLGTSQLSAEQIAHASGIEAPRVREALAALRAEGIVMFGKKGYHLVEH